MCYKNFYEDENLSLGAKGLLGFILSLPGDYRITLENLVKKNRNGRDAVNTFLKELLSAGYLTRTPVKVKGKFNGYSYEIHQNLAKAESEKTASENSVPVGNRSGKSDAYNNLMSHDNNKNTHDHDVDLSVFEKLFNEFNINFTTTNQKSIRNLLKKMSLDEVIEYLRETYAHLKNHPKITNLPGAFSKKIAKGERQAAYKESNFKTLQSTADGVSIKEASLPSLEEIEQNRNKNSSIMNSEEFKKLLEINLKKYSGNRAQAVSMAMAQMCSSKLHVV